MHKYNIEENITKLSMGHNFFDWFIYQCYCSGEISESMGQSPDGVITPLNNDNLLL